MKSDYHGKRTDAPEDAIGRSVPGHARRLSVYDARDNETVMAHFVGLDHFSEFERDTRVRGRIITRAIARRRAHVYAHFAAYGELPGNDPQIEFHI